MSSGVLVSLCAPETKPCLYIVGPQKSLFTNSDGEEDSHGNSPPSGHAPPQGSACSDRAGDVNALPRTRVYDG